MYWLIDKRLTLSIVCCTPLQPIAQRHNRFEIYPGALGYKSSKTNEIYTHGTANSIQNTKTPFDGLNYKIYA